MTSSGREPEGLTRTDRAADFSGHQRGSDDTSAGSGRLDSASFFLGSFSALAPLPYTGWRRAPARVLRRSLLAVLAAAHRAASGLAISSCAAQCFRPSIRHVSRCRRGADPCRRSARRRGSRWPSSASPRRSDASISASFFSEPTIARLTTLAARPPWRLAVGRHGVPAPDYRSSGFRIWRRKTGRSGVRCAQFHGPAVADHSARVWSVRAARPTAPR